MHSTRLLSLVSEIGAFLLAASCSGCDLPGVLLCDGCRQAIAPAPVRVRTPRGLEVQAALPFDGVAARCIRRLKSEGDTLLVRPLGDALAAVLCPLLGDGVHAVPVPTSRTSFRRRGYRVPDMLIRRTGADPWPLLRHHGAHTDQRGLGAVERAENVRGSMRVRRHGGGARVVLVDDVITTGATLDEASEVLRAAGFEVAGAVALAATRRHSRSMADPSRTRMK